MSDDYDLSDDELAALDAAMAEGRRREIAVEHVLFKTLEYVEHRHPGLLDFIERSLDHLGDHADAEDKDDDAVREIARKMLAGARKP